MATPSFDRMKINCQYPLFSFCILTKCVSWLCCFTTPGLSISHRFFTYKPQVLSRDHALTVVGRDVINQICYVLDKQMHAVINEGALCIAGNYNILPYSSMHIIIIIIIIIIIMFSYSAVAVRGSAQCALQTKSLLKVLKSGKACLKVICVYKKMGFYVLFERAQCRT